MTVGYPDAETDIASPIESGEIPNPREALEDIRGIDNEILRIREDKKLDRNQKMEQMSALMQRRNDLTDRLQAARVREFRGFVDSLNLKEIGITPFFPTQDPRSNLTIDGDLLVNMAELSVKGPEASIIAREKLARDAVRKAELRKDLMNIEQKERAHPLSPQDFARKLRCVAELKEIEKTQGA
jgi:hypothetical protein